MQRAVYVYRAYTTTGSDQLNTKLLVLQAHGKKYIKYFSKSNFRIVIKIIIKKYMKTIEWRSTSSVNIYSIMLFYLSNVSFSIMREDFLTKVVMVYW
jgi:hypothetical protein